MIAPIALLLVVVAYRIVVGISGSGDMHGLLHNFSPLASIALCGAVFLPRRVAAVLPVACLVLSDLALDAFYKTPFLSPDILPRYLALVLIGLIGFAIRGKVRLAGLLAGSLAGSLLFYVLTNTGSWISNPTYAKTAAGWVQALTIGDGNPAHPSTLWFYSHTLVSDLLFTLLFAACVAASARQQETPATLIAVQS